MALWNFRRLPVLFVPAVEREKDMLAIDFVPSAIESVVVSLG